MYRIWGEKEPNFVTVNLVGEKVFKGEIFDSGIDIIVLFNGEEFIYIPIYHIESIATDTTDSDYTQHSDLPIINLSLSQNGLSLDDVLKEAKGIYLELYISTKKSLHGTVLEVLEDYIVFYSPIYKTLYIAKKHLKWLIPYSTSERPYGLSDSEFYDQYRKQKYKADLMQQLETLSNKLVVLNLDNKKHHIGKIRTISNAMMELQTVNLESVYVNIAHIQTIHEV